MRLQLPKIMDVRYPCNSAQNNCPYLLLSREFEAWFMKQKKIMRPVSSNEPPSNNVSRLFTEFSNYVLIIAISVYIMSSNSAQANPIHHKASTSAGKDEVDKINFMNLQCSNVDGNRILSNTPLSNDALLKRLKAVVISCNMALHETKGLTDNYVSTKLFWRPGTVFRRKRGLKNMTQVVLHAIPCFQNKNRF